MRIHLFLVTCALIIIVMSCSTDSEKEKVGEELFPYSDQSNSGNWILNNTLSDEFDGIQIDLIKWVNLYPGWNGRFPSWFVKENAIINNGELNIIMKKEHLPEMDDEFEYSTGVIRSNNSFKYGYCEIKAKCMNSAGSSAFFLNNVQADWWTEIDVFEIGGNASGYEYIINTNLHEFYNPDNVVMPFVFNIETHYSDAFSPTSEWRPDAGYHIYGVEWDMSSIKWYVDGSLLRETTNSKWHQEQFINIDSETMPDWLGLPNDNDLPSVFNVDYVRTWQKP